jgi:hypothetical protein
MHGYETAGPTFGLFIATLVIGAIAFLIKECFLSPKKPSARARAEAAQRAAQLKADKAAIAARLARAAQAQADARRSRR